MTTTTSGLSTPTPASAQAGITRLAVSPSETGRLLSLSLSEVYARMRSGELQSYRDGRARRVIMASITAYLARRLAENTEWQPLVPQPPRRRKQASKARG